jgi:hypothetical protein
MPPNAFKTIALDFALQVRGIEDTYVTTGGFRVVLAKEPTDFLRPSPWHCDTQLPVGFQHAVNLFDEADVIRDVLQDLRANKPVNRVIR